MKNKLLFSLGVGFQCLNVLGILIFLAVKFMPTIIWSDLIMGAIAYALFNILTIVAIVFGMHKEAKEEKQEDLPKVKVKRKRGRPRKQ